MTDARRLDYAWAALSAITIVTWWLGHTSAGPGLASRTAITIAAVAIAAVKAQLIIRYFMEVRTAPAWLRAATTGWLGTLIAVILVLYLW